MKSIFNSKTLVLVLSLTSFHSAIADCLSTNQVCLAQLPPVAACDLQVYRAYYPNPAPMAIYQTCLSNYMNGLANCQAQFNQCNSGGTYSPPQVSVVQ